MNRLITFSAAVSLLVGVTGTAFAESMGEAEYKSSCATCHGVDGKGGGEFAEFLKGGAPSLRVLSKNNGGVFPYDRVYKIIDGRTAVKKHGSREMPIWGDQYTAESVKDHGPFFGEYYAEDAINARVLGLIDHIHKLQDK
ncbi:MAG: cytochrome c [Pseudomonadota bacterium]